MPITPQQLFIALDYSDAEKALAMAKIVAKTGAGLKLGLEFFSRYGGAGVAPFRSLGVPLFLDLKLHDIPNTVAGAVRAISALGVDYLTVHASGGAAMLAAATENAGNTKVLAVTVLTSLDASMLSAVGFTDSISATVLRLADLALESGCYGVVCSPQETALLKQRFTDSLKFITPGIRPAGSDSADQRRTATPQEALAQGADYLVIGRPVTEARDPAAMIRDLLGS